MSISDASALPKLLSVLHSVPLWILAGLAAAGWVSIFAPGFGGVDVTQFKKLWGPWFWLDAVVFSVLAVACAIDLYVKNRRIRARRRRRREEHRYFQIYDPLFAALMKIHVTTSSATGAPYFSQRVENAWTELTSIKRKWPAIKAAWRALFDKQKIGPHGEVDYGGTFPINIIEKVAHANLAYCDDELLNLMGRATETRIEEGIASGDLSTQDIKLYDHIVEQRDRLKRYLER